MQYHLKYEDEDVEQKYRLVATDDDDDGEDYEDGVEGEEDGGVKDGMNSVGIHYRLILDLL